jgi:hypothetical protein
MPWFRFHSSVSVWGLRYAVSAPPLMIYNCHCTNCQTIGGGRLWDARDGARGELCVHDGRAGIRVELDAGNRRYGLFCGDCGSRMARRADPRRRGS